MYSQATNHLSKELSSFKYICFMHDDVKILNNDFLHIFAEYIEKNNLMVLGNCKNLQKTYPRKFKETHLHVIEWGRLSRWKLSIKSDCWNTVRGSCFFVRSGVFQKVKEIPYKTGRTLEFGNWSLILFGGLVADNFGKSSIGYYSTKYLESDLILEYERGYIRDQNNDEKTYTIENFLRNLKRVFSIYFYNPLVFLFKIHSYVNSKLYYKQSDEGLRLNIGRNLAYKDGYLNIDICNSIEADLVIDIKDIAFEEHSTNKVIVTDILTTYESSNVEEILKNIFKWLKKDAVLIIEDKKENNAKALGEILYKLGFSKVLREAPIHSKDAYKTKLRLVAVK